MHILVDVIWDELLHVVEVHQHIVFLFLLIKHDVSVLNKLVSDLWTHIQHVGWIKLAINSWIIVKMNASRFCGTIAI